MIIQTPVRLLQETLSYYARLGFSQAPLDGNPLLTDGSVVLEVNPDRYARAGAKLYREDWTSLAKALGAYTAVLKQRQGWLLACPSGCWIYLIEEAEPEVARSAVGPSLLGKYAGLSLETVDIDRSLKIWQILGFEHQMGSLDQGWMTLTDAGQHSVSLMKAGSCPHLFTNPSLTYFNGDLNREIIAGIRAAGFSFQEEITHFHREGEVDQVSLRDPGGLGMFVFSD